MLFPHTINAILGISALLVINLAAADPGYLSEMPAAETVVHEMRVNGERNNTSRVSTTLEILSTMLENLSDGRASQGQLTSEEAARLLDYRKTSEHIKNIQKARNSICLGNNCDSRLFASCQYEYLMSAELRREILSRYFSKAWQQRHLHMLQGTLWKDAMAISSAKKMPINFSASPNCSDGTERPSASTARQQARSKTSELECEQRCEEKVDCRDMFGHTTALGRSAGGHLPNFEKFTCDFEIRQCVENCMRGG